jgi:hypothetical protein
MSDISEKVLKITIDYIGPSSKAFLERQTRSHMSIEFGDLKRENLPELAKWVNISAGLLLNKDKAAQLSDKIRAT